MKGTKVYVDELAKSCWDCFCQDNENGRCKILGKYTDYVPKDCPLIDIKTHDRELVKEVCEKIREKIVYYPVSVLDEAGKVKANTWGISKKDIENLINQIQKEFEK